MNYKVKKETSNFKLLSEDELIEDLLKARGVEDTKAFLNAENFPLHDGMKFKNMDRALKYLDYHIKNKSKIHIIADCDCFSGDTKVKMLDGTSKTFEELEKMEKENPGREYWLYACDEQGKFHPAKGYFPHIASYHEEICVVTLDNGSQIKCTRDHRFMLRDGSYCKAEELKKGASLMPLHWDHKVARVDIIKLDKAIPMYDISVDKYHNFAIDLGDNSGIYVHNCDGVTSCAFMYNYLKSIDNNLKITFSMNKGKVHGIVLEELENYKFDLLIAPDCGTNDCKACTKLYNDGKDIIILDHHIIQKNNINAIVVNNQDGVYANPTLSGVGVCYKFAKEYDRIHGLNYADNFLDLVALGILGDMSDIRNTETRRLVLEGVKNVKNNFFKEMLLKQGVVEEIKDPVSVTIQDMCFKLSPPLNAVVRVGTDDERRDVLKALLGFDETREYKPRKTKNNPEPETEIQTLQKAMAREVINIKGRQNRLVEKRVKDIEKKIEEEGLTEDKIIVVDATSILTESTFTGLIANKLAKKYKRPVLLLREFDEDNFGGSGRNYDLSPIGDLNKFISEEGLAEGKGHSNAFGVSMKKENVLPLIEYSNTKLKNTKIEDVYWVDYEIALPYLKEKDALKVAKLAPIFGGNVEAPSFAITGVRLKPDDIQLIGKNRNVIKINSRNFTFIKFFANEEEYNKLIGKSNGFNKNGKKEIMLDIIAEFNINEFAGKKYLQILIKDYNIAQNNKKEIKF